MPIVPPWAVKSPMRAAGIFPMRTVADPFVIISGGPTQTHVSVALAAGIIPIRVMGEPGPVIGPPTCGTGTGAGMTIGQRCISVMRAAGCPMIFSSSLLLQ